MRRALVWAAAGALFVRACDVVGSILAARAAGVPWKPGHLVDPPARLSDFDRYYLNAPGPMS